MPRHLPKAVSQYSWPVSRSTNFYYGASLSTFSSIIPGDLRRSTNMGKRKRKSKQEQQSPVFPSPQSTMMQGRLQQKKRNTTAIQPRATSQMDACPPQVNVKLWNRFYEPLILLLAYGKSQGRHVKSDEASSEMYMGGGNKTLSKKFLDELAYVCDYSPSGDTVAAIVIRPVVVTRRLQLQCIFIYSALTL